MLDSFGISNAVQWRITTHISMKRKVSTPSFFGSHPVFSLDQAARRAAGHKDTFEYAWIIHTFWKHHGVWCTAE